MYLFKLDKYEKYLSLIVVRDDNVTMHNIELNLAEKKSTIALVGTAGDLRKIVRPHNKLRKSIFRHYQTVEFR